MLDRVRRSRGVLAVASALAGSMALVTMVGASSVPPTRPIRADQTDGFAQGRLTTFTYGMNFDCVETPAEDLDKTVDGTKAAARMQIDPQEVNGPHCVAAHQPPLGPTGDPIQNVEKLFVLVPFFETNPAVPAASNADCTPGLGNLAALLQLHFLTVDCDHMGPALQAVTARLGLKRADGVTGIIPDAFKTPTPGDPTKVAPVQCPEPGGNLTAHHGPFGTCVTHTNIIDLGPVVGSILGLDVVRLPTPNHDHIIRDANFGRVWWQVVVDLVFDPSVWPDVNGTHGLTSVDALRAAQAKGQVSGDTPTNFFLFFDSRPNPHS